MSAYYQIVEGLHGKYILGCDPVDLTNNSIPNCFRLLPDAFEYISRDYSPYAGLKDQEKLEKMRNESTPYNIQREMLKPKDWDDTTKRLKELLNSLDKASIDTSKMSFLERFKLVVKILEIREELGFYFADAFVRHYGIDLHLKVSLSPGTVELSDISHRGSNKT